jgi:hypothetical protein
LANTTRTSKKTLRGSIYEDRETSSRNAIMNPPSPLETETTSLQQVEEKILIHMIVGLFHIQLTNHPKNPFL